MDKLLLRECSANLMRKIINRQYELDVFRIVASLGVMLFHYTFRGFAADNLSILPFPELGEIFKYGYLGVYAFCMISGYSVFISSTPLGLKDYVISRLLRLYPTFWIAVTLTSVFTLLIGGDRYSITLIQYVINLTMLNSLIGINSVDGTYWFMLLIMRFYFLIAIVIFLKLEKYQEYLAGIWLLLAFIITFFNLPILGLFLIPEYAPFFIAGIVFLAAKTKGWNLYKYVIIIISLFYSIYLIGTNTNIMQQYYHATFSIFVTSFLILSFYLAFYFITIRKRPLTLSQDFILYGTATYPLFLIHHNIGFMIFNSLGKLCNKYLLLSVTVVIMILVSLFITKYIDPYIYDKLRRAINAIVSFTENILRKTFS